MAENKKKVKRRTLYGYDNKLRKTLRITGVESDVAMTIDNKAATFNIFNELGTVLKKKKSVLFIKSGISSLVLDDEKTDVAYGMIKENVSPKLRKLNNISFYMLGYEMNIDKADEYIKKLLKETTKENEPNKQTTKDMNLGLMADKLFNLGNANNELSAKNDAAKEILKGVCEDGEVLSKNGGKLVILLGTEPGRTGVDTEKMKKDGIYETYKDMGKSFYVVTVSDGTKKQRNSSIKADAIKRELYTDSQLYTMAEGYNQNNSIIKKNSYQLEAAKDYLSSHLGVGEHSVEFNGKEYIVKISERAGIPSIDMNRMKKDGVFDTYKKKQADLKHLRVKILIEK